MVESYKNVTTPVGSKASKENPDLIERGIFIEKDNYTKCSFRSKGSFPANKVAMDHFGGGGHVNAAGGEYKGSLAETIEKYKSILPDYKKYLDD